MGPRPTGRRTPIPRPWQVRLHTCDDGVWGIHCGCLLPMADECSAAVLAAHAAMARHVAGLLKEGPC